MFTAILQGMTLAVVTAVPPDDSVTAASAKRFDVLGLQVCMGDPGDGQPCHVKLYPPRSGKTQEEDSGNGAGESLPIEVSVFGKRLCLGAVPPDATCDVRLGPTVEAADHVEA